MSDSFSGICSLDCDEAFCCEKTENVDISKIIIDSIDINTHPSNWQRQIGYVPQDTYLVDDTIKSNIAFGVPLDEINFELVRTK